MHLSKSLTVTTLVVCGVHSAPLVPAIFSDQIVAHEFHDAHPMADQVTGETIVMSANPRPSFVDWTSSSSYLVSPPTTPSSRFNRPVTTMQKKGPNITKHVLLEVLTPIKRSKVNDSDKFYNLKVTDLQKGPFKSDEERDRMLLASY